MKGKREGGGGENIRAILLNRPVNFFQRDSRGVVWLDAPLLIYAKQIFPIISSLKASLEVLFKSRTL